MTALVTGFNRKRKSDGPTPKLISLPLATSAAGFAGSLVCDDGTGKIVVGSASTSLVAVGMATKDFDQAVEDVSIDVERGVFRFANSAGGDAITIADRDKFVYIVDDNTVARTDGGVARSKAGRVYDVDTNGVWVSVGVDPLVNAKGYVPISLYDFREVSSGGDVGAIAANGGILASDTTPILRGDAAEAQEISWATGNSDLIAAQFCLPPDFDGTYDVILETWVSSGTTNDADLVVETSWDGGAVVTDAVVDAGAAAAHKSIATIAAADVPDSASYVTIMLTPPTHATDTIQLHAARLTYVRKATA